jgi:carboxymethylenebutenolidase
MMGWIRLNAADGHALDAYWAQPAAPQGAIVVLQEIFGVNPHIRALCDRYCEQGYLAIAPALFDRVSRSQVLGYDARGIALGREIRGQLSDAQALLDVQAAVDWAAVQLGPQAKIAVMGFCWGGTLAWLAVTRLSGLRCAVAYYGTGIAAYVDETPKVPMLLHFGKQDAHIPAEHVDKIAQAWPELPLYRYEAGHGFNCDDRPAYHPSSAELAAARTHEFLKDHLKC